MLQRCTVILSLILVALMLFAAGQYIYGVAYERGTQHGFFAVRVEDVKEDAEGYTILLEYEDSCCLHYCRK